jgi:hypothetical protein
MVLEFQLVRVLAWGRTQTAEDALLRHKEQRFREEGETAPRPAQRGEMGVTVQSVQIVTISSSFKINILEGLLLIYCCKFNSLLLFSPVGVMLPLRRALS